MSLSTSDLINDSFSISEPPPKDQVKHKDFTADEHLKAQKKLDAQDNPLITQLQKEARERTFLSGPGEAPARKPRGRPPKAVTPPTTPTRSKTPPPPPQESTEKKKGSEESRLRRIKQIYAYFKLYPHLPGVVGTSDMRPFDLKTLDQILNVCKSEAGSDGSSSLEYEMIAKIFFGALYYFENCCGFACTSLFKDQSTIPGLLRFLASNPPGSFAYYLQLCNEAGSGVELELREIAINFIDFLPNNVYTRLITKIGYKLYDFHVYKTNDYLQKMKEQMASQPPNPEIQKRVSALKNKSKK